MFLTKEQVLGYKTTQTMYLGLSNMYFINIQHYWITYYGQGAELGNRVKTKMNKKCFQGIFQANKTAFHNRVPTGELRPTAFRYPF